MKWHSTGYQEPRQTNWNINSVLFSGCANELPFTPQYVLTDCLDCLSQHSFQSHHSCFETDCLDCLSQHSFQSHQFFFVLISTNDCFEQLLFCFCSCVLFGGLLQIVIWIPHSLDIKTAFLQDLSLLGPTWMWDVFQFCFIGKHMFRHNDSMASLLSTGKQFQLQCLLLWIWCHQDLVWSVATLSLIHIWRCRRIERCRSRWSPYH